MLDQHKREEQWRQRQWLMEQQARVRHTSLGEHKSHHHHNFCPVTSGTVEERQCFPPNFLRLWRVGGGGVIIL